MKRLTLTLAGGAAAAACFLGAGPASAALHSAPEKFPATATMSATSVSVTITNQSPYNGTCFASVGDIKDLATYKQYAAVYNAVVAGTRPSSDLAAAGDALDGKTHYGTISIDPAAGKSASGTLSNIESGKTGFSIMQICFSINAPVDIDDPEDVPVEREGYGGASVYSVDASGGGTGGGAGGTGSLDGILGGLDLFGSLG